MMKVLDYLRDPIWQAIGAAIGVIAIMVSIFITYDVFRRTDSESTVAQLYAYNRYISATTLSEDSDIALTADGKLYSSILQYAATISNPNAHAILADDFVEPIRFQVGEGWDIVAVSNVNTAYDPFDTTTQPISVEWTRVNTNTYEMKPALINPMERIDVLFYLSAPVPQRPASTLESQSERRGIKPFVPARLGRWTGRIVNVRLVEYPPPVVRDPVHTFFSIQLTLSGWEVYASLGIACLLSIIVIYVAIRADAVPTFTRSSSTWMILIVLLSLWSAVVIVDIFTLPASIWWFDSEVISRMVWVAPFLYILLLLVLILKLVKKQLRLGGKRKQDLPATKDN